MAGVGLVAVLACAGTPREPLADLHPYVWARSSEVELLLCRWTRTEVPVSWPRDVDAEADRAFEAARGAWERAGLGLHLPRVEPEGARIRLALAEGPVRRDDGRAGAALTRADCGLESDGGARLVHAEIEIARDAVDLRGHVRPHTPAELAGIAAHEMGHALGFQGHSRRGRDEPMLRSAEALRRIGARLLRGETMHSDALAALYARPSGLRLRRATVSRYRTETVDALAALAVRDRLAGPFLRTGDSRARIFWRSADGREFGAWIGNLVETLDDPTRILLIAERAARERLAEERAR